MSKIDDSIANAVARIKESCAIDVQFGKRDIKSSRRPIIELIPEDDSTITTNNSSAFTLMLPLTINIVVDFEQELKAFEILDQCLRSLNSINPSADGVGLPQSGGVGTAAITPTYEASTFRLSFPYTLSFLITGA